MTLANRSIAVLGAVALGTLIPLAAAAQGYGSDLGAQVDRLQRDIAALQRYVYSATPGSATPSGGGAIDTAYRERLEVRLGSLEEQVRNLTGQVERANHGVARMQQRLDKLVADLDYRLAALERGEKTGGAETAGATEPRPAGSPAGPGDAPGGSATASAAASLPTGTPMELYAKGQQLLAQARYDDAEAAFREFMKRYGDNQLAENARYWLGETYYVRKRYDEAAATFLEGYQKNPKGSKSADNLLKLGLSLVGLQKNSEACVAFNKLAAEHPKAPEHIARRAQHERSQIGCS